MELSIENNNLIIQSDTSFNSISNTISIPLHKIKAYQIQRTKAYERLILYRENQQPVFVVLKDNNSSQKELLLSFLEDNKIIRVASLGSLSGLSFRKALQKGFLSLLIPLTIFCLILSIELIFHYPFYNLLGLFFINLLLIIILIFFMARQMRRNFKIDTDIICFLMGMMMMVMTILIPDRIYILFHDPVSVKKVNNIKSYPNQKFFIINNVLCDTTLTGYYNVFNNSRRSFYFSVKHYFISPLYSSEDDPKSLNHHYWIADMFSQKISKSLSRQNEARIWFMNQKSHEFNLLINSKSYFYEVVYSNLNSAFRDKSYYSALESTGRTESLTAILKPFKESFQEFRQSNIKELIIMTAGIILCFLLNIYLVARYK